ncbi:MAG: hypothetical protein Q8936_12525 [Bacillota bacterium]|nr:hypothetical protein [Bacillota bacterium]
MKGKIIYVDFTKKEAKPQITGNLFSKLIKSIQNTINGLYKKFHHKHPENKNKHVL